MKNLYNNVIFILMTLFMVIIAREIMVLLHEWSHGILAWIFGAKANPFDIHYGGWLLLDVDEAVNYLTLYKEGKIWTITGIAFLPIIINTLIYLFCLWTLSFSSIHSKKMLCAFLFWFIVVNLGEVYSYIPIRTFASHGDVGNVIHVLNISPWVIFIPGVIFVSAATWHLFKYLLPKIYLINHMILFQKTSYLLLTLLTYFYWYGNSGSHSYGNISKIFSLVSVALIPFLFVICYPSRKWVLREIKKLTG